MPQYDEIYIVSDLHMGGKAGFQILRETKRLADFVGWVTRQRPNGRVALILNGDVIDTLAEDDNRSYIAVDNAVPVVRRIMDDPAFAPVWAALAELVRTPGRSLVFILGNHDIELSLPPVQQAIFDRLAGDDPAARGRIEFSTMGAGYSCRVGGKRVFCTHGNEVDPWNFIRYEDLAKAGRRLNCGRSLKDSEWEPNAGTKMVNDIMNGVKRRYPWIDLLKPEAQAAIGVLLAIDPGQLEKIRNILPVVGEWTKGKMEADGRLSADGFQTPAASRPQQANLDKLLGPSLRQGLTQAGGGRPATDDLLLMAEEQYKNFNIEDEATDGTLGTWQYLSDRLTGWFRGVGKEEALRRALTDWLSGDGTFAITDQDETCKKVVDSVGGDIDFIVTGHTHLERAIDLVDGRFYFNCGTWIRLLRFTDKILKDEASFKPVYDLLTTGTMAAIDGAIFNGEPFVLDRSSAVCIADASGTVTGGLYHIEQLANGSIQPKKIN